MNPAKKSEKKAYSQSGPKLQNPHDIYSKDACAEGESQNSMAGTPTPKKAGQSEPKLRRMTVAFLDLAIRSDLEAKIKQATGFKIVSHGFGVVDYTLDNQVRQSKIYGWIEDFKEKVELLDGECFSKFFDKVEREAKWKILGETGEVFTTFPELFLSLPNISEEFQKCLIHRDQGETVDEARVRAEDMVAEAEAQAKEMRAQADAKVQELRAQAEAKANQRVAEAKAQAQKRIARAQAQESMSQAPGSMIFRFF